MGTRYTICCWAINRSDPQNLLSVTLDVPLQLPHGMRQLHPVFNVVKLSAALEDPILGRKLQAPPPPIVVDREEE